MVLSLEKAVFSLKMLRRLHLSGWELSFYHDGYVYDPRPMKEIVYCTTLGDARFLSETVRKSGAVLEVLILRSNSVMGVDIGPEDSSAIPLLRGHEGAPVKPISNVPHLSALTNLDLSMHIRIHLTSTFRLSCLAWISFTLDSTLTRVSYSSTAILPL